MSNKKYWQSFGELKESDSFQQSAQNEFKEDLLPMEDISSEGDMDGATPRRDFLKYLGFSTAAAAIAASCEIPVRRAIPYLQKPDTVAPGVANYYASTYVNGGDAISVVVKQRDGRPIKIEGNDLSTITGEGAQHTSSGTSAQAQASVLDLYDTSRLRHPLQRSGADFKEVSSFDAVDKMINNKLGNIGSGKVVLLTPTINSRTSQAVIDRFLSGRPGAQHVQYDAVSYSALIQANTESYGKPFIPSYNFAAADIIVSLGADFLGTWLSPVEFSRQYAKNRRIATNDHEPKLSRHFHFESSLSLTGSNADDRYTHKPSETGAVALAILAALGGGVTAPSLDAKLNSGVQAAAKALKFANGRALVVCGSNDTHIQIIVNAINEKIGANGATIDWLRSNNTRKGLDTEMTNLVNAIKENKVAGLIVYGCNPVYTHPEGQEIAKGIAKMQLSVSLNGTLDETSEQCEFVVPSHHWLESWGDAEIKTNALSFMQPLINPLFKTRAYQDSLIKWTPDSAAVVSAARAATQVNDTAAAVIMTAPVASVSPNAQENYESFHKRYWTNTLGSTELYFKAIQDGVVYMPVDGSLPYASNANLAVSAAKAVGMKKGDIEVVLYEKVSVGNGSQANNPWLQELPDPISKVTWDNYAMMSPELAKKLVGIDVINNSREADSYEVTPEKPVVKITVNGKSLELPVLIMPGINNATIAVALGYGRASADASKSLDRVGRAATGAGKNAYPMVSFNGLNYIFMAAATAQKTDATYPLAQTQVHGALHDGQHQRPIIYETNLNTFREEPGKLLEEIREEKKKLLADGKTDYVTEGTIYPNYEKPGIKWGMSIDLNTCTGCSACVVACTAENNVSVVGKSQVQKAHEMHWLRIDRYFTGDISNPDVVFQPMMCQHCDNAPCENVCPVAATNHSSEGLNQMTYNRCIGTRYCANNCPFKVRRFNWLDYTGADSFKDNQQPLRGTELSEAVFQMNDDLTRMVLNPDVTVRSRGVIEKCSFCVQRLQENKLVAKKEQDPGKVRNVQTACMQACPTNAISFGNVNDPESMVSKARKDDNRNFYVLEQLHVLPNVSYLAKVRNTDRKIGVTEA